MTEQNLGHARIALYEAITEASAAMDFALAVIDPRGLDGLPIEIDEKHRKTAVSKLEKSVAALRNAHCTFEDWRINGGGMTRVIKPAPLCD